MSRAWTDEEARKFTAPCVDRWQWDAWLAAHDARVRRDAAESTYAAAYRAGWLDGQNGSIPDPRMAYPEETP